MYTTTSKSLKTISPTDHSNAKPTMTTSLLASTTAGNQLHFSYDPPLPPEQFHRRTRNTHNTRSTRIPATSRKTYANGVKQKSIFSGRNLMSPSTRRDDSFHLRPERAVTLQSFADDVHRLRLRRSWQLNFDY